MSENISLREGYDVNDARFVKTGGDFQALQQIRLLTNDIGKQLENSVSILGKKDREPLFRELNEADRENNLKKLQELQSKVGNVIRQSTDLKKQAEQSLRKLNLPEQKLQQKLDQFVALSLDEKEKFLKEELAEREKNFAEYQKSLKLNLKHFSPNSIKAYLESFKDLATIGEQQRWLKLFKETELAPRKALTEKFESFSKQRQEKYQKFFTLSRHEKEELVEDMENDLNNEYQYKLYQENDAKYLSSDSKHQAYMWFIKRERTIGEREKALEMLRVHLQVEKNLWREYEALPEHVRLKLRKNFAKIYAEQVKPKLKYEIKHDSAPRDFKDLSSHEREILFAYLKGKNSEMAEENELNEELEYDYEVKLDEALDKHIIRENTLKEFKAWFKDELLKDETPNKKHCRDLIENFYKYEEIDKRVKNLDEFTMLTKKLNKEGGMSKKEKKDREEKFHEASFEDRQKMVLELYEENRDWQKKSESMGKIENNERKAGGLEGMENGLENLDLQNQVRALNLSAANKEMAGKYEDAMKLYEAALILRPQDEFARRHLFVLKQMMGGLGEDTIEAKKENAAIDLELERTKQTDTMQETLTFANLAWQLGTMTKKADEYNKSSTTHDAHLDGREDSKDMKELHAAMLEESEGKVGLNAEGEAEKIFTIDQRNIRQYNHGNTRDLQKLVTEHQDQSKQNNVWNVQLKDKDGRRVEGRKGKEIGDSMMEDAEDTLAQKTISHMRASNGGKLDQKTEAKIIERAKKTKIQKRFDVH